MRFKLMVAAVAALAICTIAPATAQQNVLDQTGFAPCKDIPAGRFFDISWSKDPAVRQQQIEENCGEDASVQPPPRLAPPPRLMPPPRMAPPPRMVAPQRIQGPAVRLPPPPHNRHVAGYDDEENGVVRGPARRPTGVHQDRSMVGKKKTFVRERIPAELRPRSYACSIVNGVPTEVPDDGRVPGRCVDYSGGQ